jgi:hypothetical protein
MQGEFDFDKYPNKAGHRGVRTSIKSAEDINPHLRRLHKMIMIELESVYPGGLTGTELAQRLNRNEVIRYDYRYRKNKKK